MDLIQDFGAMSSFAAEVLSAKSDFDTMCGELDKLIETIDGQWQGKAQIEFAGAYSSIKKKLKTVGEHLESFAIAVKTASVITADIDGSTRF